MRAAELSPRDPLGAGTTPPSCGETVTSSTGEGVGEADSTVEAVSPGLEGETVGLLVGIVGWGVGEAEEKRVGFVGEVVGAMKPTIVGDCEGFFVGDAEGELEGFNVGERLGE